MNILLINHYAGCIEYGMEYRPYYMAQEWIKMGHKVTVASSSFSHLRSTQPDIKNDLTTEYIDEIEYVWLKGPSYAGNGIGRVLNMLTFIQKLYSYKNFFIEKNPNVVIASSTYPLDIYPARSIAKASGAKLVFEVHDLWPLSPMELGNMSKWHPFIMVMQKAENDAYKYADKVVSMLPKTLQHMVEHGMCSDKFVYIPNGISIDEWNKQKQEIPKEHTEILDNLHEQGYTVIGYAGSHGIANALHIAIEAAKKLEHENIAFVFVGKGPEKESLEAVTAINCLKNVFWLPPVNKECIPELLDNMDMLYIGWSKNSLYRFGISPNKLMDYMMAGKPIVHSVSAGNDPVAECGCGISVEAENPDKLADAILEMMKKTSAEREKMGRRGYEYVTKNHDYQVLAKRFIDNLII